MGDSGLTPYQLPGFRTDFAGKLRSPSGTLSHTSREPTATCHRQKPGAVPPTLVSHSTVTANATPPISPTAESNPTSPQERGRINMLNAPAKSAAPSIPNTEKAGKGPRAKCSKITLIHDAEK